MKIETVKIGLVKPNPNNPRIIRDEKFKGLVKSIQDFPQMLQIRPIVVNDEMIVLGGNQRLRACKDAGLKEIPIIKASELTEEQQEEFIIKDNIGYGEWDWDSLKTEWNTNKISEWLGENINNDQNITEEKTEYLKPYKKTHILISCDADTFFDIQNLLQQIKNNPNIEYESTSN